jgi:hypothetical protein
MKLRRKKKKQTKRKKETQFYLMKFGQIGNLSEDDIDNYFHVVEEEEISSRWIR